MSTWARTSTGDIVLPTIGQGASCIVTDIDECAAIRIRDGLLMWQGEWKLDLSQGTPWASVVGVKNPTLVAFSTMMRGAILDLGAPAIASVTQLSIAYYRQLRNLAYAVQAKMLSGATIQGGSSGPNGQPYVVVQQSPAPGPA